MKRIKLLDIVERQGDNKYSLLFLGENDRAFVLTTGYNETWAIITALKNIKPQRPITSNLLHNVVSISGLTVKDIIIATTKDNIYFANIKFEGTGKVHNMDCRPSDGIALAFQNSAPIFISDHLLEERGFPLPEKYKNIQPTEKGINAIIAKSLDKQAVQHSELRKVTKEHISEITMEIVDFVHRR